MIDSYYNTGVFDYTTLRRGKVQPVSEFFRTINREYQDYLCVTYNNNNTIHFFEYELYYLLRYLEEMNIFSIDNLSASMVLTHIKFVKQSRQRAVLCGLRQYFRYAQRENLTKAIAGIHAYRYKRIIPTLTDNEQSGIKSAIDSVSILYRDAAIVLLGLSTGIRACDLIKLKLSDIDWVNETISFRQSKTSNTVCLLTISVGNALANYISKERPSTDNNFLFLRQLAPFEPLADHASCHSIVSREIKIVCISKHNRFYGMQMLRHKTTSMMVKNEVPVATIAAVLGHANTDLTDIYITTDETRQENYVSPIVNISKEVYHD